MKEKLQNIETIGENVGEIFPEIIPGDVQDGANASDNKDEFAMTDEEVEGRLALERNMGFRNTFRFKADV